MTEPAKTSDRISMLFVDASALPEPEREPFLFRACPDSEAIRREVLSLLRSAKRAPDQFLPSSHDPSATPRHRPKPPDLSGYRLRERFTIGTLIGEGGMSVVYEGWQEQPRRRVAVKIMRPECVSPKVLRRFRDEPEIIAQLHHPNIVHVFEADVEDFGAGPQPYFVMDYVDGPTLTDYARDHKLPQRERLNLFLAVCDAVQEAHQKGVIHRDIKPSNILVRGEHATPVLLDFGVAKVLASSGMAVEHTLSEGVLLLGTLQYMSPEQCGVGGIVDRESPIGDRESPIGDRESLIGDRESLIGDRESLFSHHGPSVISPPSPWEGAGGGPAFRASGPQPLDIRSDVYALGVVLYELLTGRLPYDVSNMTILSAARTVCETTPTPPSQFDRRLRGDLDAVILKCLEKDRTRRYASVTHLADDVRRYLAGEPTLARPATRWRRAFHWIAKHPKLTTAALAFIAGLLAWLPAKFAWERGLHMGASFNFPYKFEPTFDGATVFLKDSKGKELETFFTQVNEGIRLAEVLPSLRTGGVGLRVAVGILGPQESANEPGLTIYRWNQDGQTLEAVWERKNPEPGPLPDPHARGYKLEDFLFANGCVADIFSEIPGDEVVAVYQASSYTQCVLQVHDLEGHVHYRVWTDAQIEKMIWLPELRLLVCYGGDGSAFRLAREGMPNEPDDRYRHTKVVFALRPVFNEQYDTFLCLEPVALERTIRPEWCRMLAPCDVMDNFVDHVLLCRAERGGFLVNVTLKPDPQTRHIESGSIEFGPDGVLRTRHVDADNIKAAVTPGTESISMRLLKELNLLPHPAIRDEWIPVKTKGEKTERLCNLRDCELDPDGGPPHPHSTIDCPLNGYGVHGSPYRWARLLKEGSGFSNGFPPTMGPNTPSPPS